MAFEPLDIFGFENEQITRQYTLRAGTADNSTPFDLSGSITFEADIRDQKNALVLHLASTGENPGIVINDPPTSGVIAITIQQGAIPYLATRSLKYDLLMLTDGVPRRLWGGNVRIAQGVTQP